MLLLCFGINIKDKYAWSVIQDAEYKPHIKLAAITHTVKPWMVG